MAANMIKPVASIAFACLCFALPAAWGEELPDPTRPAVGIGDSGTAASQAYPQVKGLRSVIVSAQRCAAIIDGKTITLGARYGSETLVEVNLSGVVLRGEHGQRTLNLFPAVGMKMTQTLPQGNGAAICKLDQNKDRKNPARQAGQKEKK